MVAPDTPLVTVFSRDPPIRLGLVAFGSIRKVRALFTLISSATLSVVPIKLVPTVVPLLPASAQKAVASLSLAHIHALPFHLATWLAAQLCGSW